MQYVHRLLTNKISDSRARYARDLLLELVASPAISPQYKLQLSYKSNDLSCETSRSRNHIHVYMTTSNEKHYVLLVETLSRKNSSADAHAASPMSQLSDADLSIECLSIETTDIDASKHLLGAFDSILEKIIVKN